MSRHRHDLGFCVVLALVTLALWLVDVHPSLRQSQAQQRRQAPTQRCRAVVTATDNSHVRINLIVKTELQLVTLRLASGPHRGHEMEAQNQLTGKMEMDEFYQPGAVVLVEYEEVDGKPAHALVRGHYRLRLQWLLIGLFAALLLALAGLTGAKAILSFGLAAVALWRVFIPLLLAGWPPLWTGLALVAGLTAVITFSVGGVNRRGLATFAGSMLGVLLTCGLAILFTRAFHLHGAIRPFAETLLYSGYHNLDLTHLFVASVFISSSGAVMDLAMDIAATMDEIHRRQPQLGLVEHVRSGLRVGRAVIGTMTTTLLLAYSGSHLAMFMLFVARGLPLQVVANSPMVSAEILNILVGSFGLVTVAPFTAVVAGLLYRRSGDES